MLSSHVMEAIEFALSHGTLHDAYQIDKDAYLLAMSDMLSWPLPIPDLLAFQDAILVSPMRRAGAVRLTFDCEHHVEWKARGWIIRNGSSIDMTSITIGNHLWTRYVKGTIM